MTTLVAAQSASSPSEIIRAGIIGLDTSHAPAFTRAFNDPKAKGDLARVQVVAAFPGGSPDIASSRDRVKGFTEQLRGMDVEICDSIAQLLERVDVVLIESVDGRPHLEQLVPVVKAKKRVFIDKPLAGNLVDALAIAELAKKYDVPWFSSSSLRFSPGAFRFREGATEAGAIQGAMTWGPCSLEATHPDLYWYGIHGVETLFTIMGPGCLEVSRTHAPQADQAVGLWEGGRIGSFYGMRAGKTGYGGTVFGEKEIVPVGPYAGYEPLVEQIAKFFVTGIPPLDFPETLEMFAFMTAADESKKRGGQSVTLKEVMDDAKTKVPARLAALGE
jgi:hypothetical protein